MHGGFVSLGRFAPIGIVNRQAVAELVEATKAHAFGLDSK